MTIRELKRELYLSYSDVPKADIDELLLNYFKCDFTHLLSDAEVSNWQVTRVNRLVKKLTSGMPINKLFKKAYFFGKVFYINRHVLAPRQDSEVLVQAVLDDFKNKKDLHVLDMCTGSGVLGIIISKKLNLHVDASDISSRAIAVAKKNARKLNADLRCIKSDMFEKIYGKYDIIISNPPYISKTEWETLDISVKKYDPKISLLARDNGFEFYKRFESLAYKYLNKDGRIYLEIGDGQLETVKKIFFNQKYQFIKAFKDYNSSDRVVVIEKSDFE